MSTNWAKLFTYETLVHASSGAAGSVTAMTVFYPLDTVRSRLQVESGREARDTLSVLRDIIRDEGVESLYRGLQPVLISVCASNFVYFYTFHGLRAVFSGTDRRSSALRDLGLGAVAGMINVFITTPLWVANTRLKMQGAHLKSAESKVRAAPVKYDGMLDALQKIARGEGPAALWASVLPSLVLVSNPSLQFMIYESLKREVQLLLFGVGEERPLSGPIVFLLGAMAKSVSTIVTYPLQIVQTRQRYGGQEAARQNMISMLMHIIRQDGPLGLYRGLEAKLLQTVLTTALMFLAYEKIAAFVFVLMGSEIKKAKA